MTKITRDKRNFKFETLQLHVGQEHLWAFNESN